MNDLVFDKLTFIDKLMSSGFSREQARGQAEALDTALRETVATKSDIKDLRTELRSEMRDMEHRLTLRLGGMLVTGIAVVATLVRLL